MGLHEEKGPAVSNMKLSEALAIIILEGIEENGMVIETRVGIDPGKDRISKLGEALDVVAETTAEDSQIDRKLANALHGLSFHMSETLNHWQRCEWISDYALILSQIEAIFDGRTEIE